jgi:dUTP pyrophosphatase
MPDTVNVKVERLHESVEMPEMENPLDAAFDLRALINPTEEADAKHNGVIMPPTKRLLVRTGLKVALPQHVELQVRPRSGLANDYGIDVANSPGTVDPGYRGEVCVIVENRGTDTFKIETGDRIAQAAIRPIIRPSFKEVDEVPEDTQRGEGGFGSTGV